MGSHPILSLVTPKDIAAQLGQGLRAHRLAQNRTQMELASQSGVSVPTIKRLEATGRGSVENLLRLAWALRLETVFDGIIPAPAPARIEDVVSPKRRQRASHLPKAPS